VILNRIPIILVCTFAAILCGLGTSQAHGQTLGITPALVDAKVKRGATYSQAFTISNNTGARLRLRCSVSDFWYGEHNERIDALPGTQPRSASTWVQFSPAEQVIEPNSSAVVNAVITIPQTAAGGYYTVPIFETEAADATLAATIGKTATAAVMIRFRGLLLLTTEDATEYNLEVMNGRITPPTSSSELRMELDLRNRSTAHIRVHGMFAIVDPAGKLAGRGKVEEKRYLPGQRDTLKADWAGQLAPGRYTTIVTLTYDRAGMSPATLVYELPLEVNRRSPLQK
jgi:hypothetical protein